MKSLPPPNSFPLSRLDFEQPGIKAAVRDVEL
jgi:hypothetical protein